jgi:hypothetical protein
MTQVSDVASGPLVILTLDTGNALYQSKIKTHNDFFPGIKQLRSADFYFIKMAVKLTMRHHLNTCGRA